MEALIKIGSSEAGDTLDELKSRGLQFEVISTQDDIEEDDAYSEAIIEFEKIGLISGLISPTCPAASYKVATGYFANSFVMNWLLVTYNPSNY